MGIPKTKGPEPVPERLSVALPHGTRARLKRAAEAEHVTVPELIRRALDHVAGEVLNRSAAHG